MIVDHTFSRLPCRDSGQASLINWQYSLNQESATQNIPQNSAHQSFDVNARLLQNSATTAFSTTASCRAANIRSFQRRTDYSWFGNPPDEFGGRFVRRTWTRFPTGRINPRCPSIVRRLRSITRLPAQLMEPSRRPRQRGYFFLGIAGSYQQSRPPASTTCMAETFRLICRTTGSHA